MCGIAGFINTDGAPVDTRLIRRMTDVIAHRGPDGSGYYTRGEVALGHRRLSIIDLDSGGQPMSNEDDSLWITYNGEIFNHADIRPELEAAGHHYKSHCDTETIVHAYEQWGDQSVTRYRGMFSYAIWDQNHRRLFCARDRLGIKPFYYFWNGRLFAFASEIKVLLEHPDIRTEFNDVLLPEYLAFGYTSGEETLFAGIRKLMPGHTLTLTCGVAPSLEIKQYWDPPCPTDFEDRSDERMDRRVPDATGRSRPHAADERRATGHVLERRRRLKRDRRAHQADDDGPREDFFRWLQRIAFQRTLRGTAGG